MLLWENQEQTVYQRKEIGPALLRAVMDRFSYEWQIELATDRTPKMVVFYRSMGFREMSEFRCCGFMKV